MCISQTASVCGCETRTECVFSSVMYRQTDLIHKSTQDCQVSARVRGEDVSCGVNSCDWQDPAGEVHEGIWKHTHALNKH